MSLVGDSLALPPLPEEPGIGVDDHGALLDGADQWSVEAPGAFDGVYARSAGGHQATEVAQVFSRLVVDHNALSDQAAEDLARLLAHSLAAPGAARRRDSTLGLVIEIICCETGEVVSEAEYERVRLVRKEHGEHWPTSETLRLAYGHWLAVARAAARFWFDGGRQRVASDHKHGKGTQPSYEPAQITRVLARWYFRYEDWPTEWEYEEWRKLQLDAWRRAGITDRRLPGLLQIRKAWTTYPRAIEVAKAWVAART